MFQPSPLPTPSPPPNTSVLETLLADTQMSLVVTDRQGIVTAVRGILLTQQNWNADDYLGKPIEHLFSFRPDHAQYYRQALSGKSLTVMFPLLGRQLEIHIVPIRDAAGSIVGALGYDIDITEHMVMHRRQQERDAQLSNLFDNSLDGILLLDKHFVIQRANLVATEVYANGDSLTECVCYKKFYDYDAPCSFCPVQETFRTGKPSQGSCYNARLNKHLLLNSAPLFDPETGDLIGAFETFRDISDLIDSMEKLRSHEAFVDDIFSSIQDGMFIVDREHTVLRANPAFERMFSTFMPIVGKKCYATYCRDKICDNCPVAAMFETGQVTTLIQHREPTEMMPEVWLEHFSHPIIDKEGHIVAAICIVRDVTRRVEDEEALRRYRENLVEMIDERTRELRWSESKMRAILSWSNAPIVFIDGDAKLTFVNAAFQELTGYEETDLIGRAIEFLYEKESFEQSDLPQLRKALFAGEIARYRREVAIRRNDGTLRRVDISAAAVKDDNEKIVQIVGVCLDITELYESRVAAEAASTAKSQFLATMSHEIRTPLNGVIGLSDLLLGTELNPKQQEYAQLINASGKSLLFLINDILDFSKIEAGKLEIDSEPFELVAMVESVLGILASRACDKGLELCTSFSPDIPRRLAGDSGRIRQILLNLVGNAVKFTEHGGVRIDVTVDNVRDEDIDILFTVSDTGIGIPQGRIDRLFKAFSQADASSTRIYGGTGLGLAISRKLVHLMHGAIGVESDEGVGSSFWFTLPFPCDPMITRCLSAGTDECLAVTGSECPFFNGYFCDAITHRDIGVGYSIKGKRVLIVDDNPVQRKALCDQIASWKMEVTACDFADEATRLTIEAVRQGRPFDILLIDDLIEGEAAAALVKRLTKLFEENDPAKPRFVLLLSLADEIDAAFLKKHGADVVSKPILASMLFDAVMNQLFAADEKRHHDSGIIMPNAAKLEEYVRRRTKRKMQIPNNENSDVSIFAGKVHLLVVEDNRVNQIVAKNLLVEAGFTCDIAINGYEACRAVMKNTYDIVLMDCQMPEMDGYEATNLIRRWELEQGRSRIPIIALTANATKDDVQKCLDSGMDAYCSKPINPKTVIRIIEKHYAQGRKNE